MGALIGAVANAIITKSAVGNAGAAASVSKTKLGANALGATALTMVDWAAVANKDPQALGQLAALLITWAITLYGRWKADRG